jgi:hypothetical protein
MKADIEPLLQRMISIDDFKPESIEEPREMVNRINKFSPERAIFNGESQ